MQAIWIGLIGIVAGVLPVIAANRYVDFQSYSHYALPASLAAAVFITGLLFSLRPAGIVIHAFAILAAFAVLAHFAYSFQVVDEEQTIARFWQQVAWRAPSIKPQTTLFVNYPGLNYGDNIDAVDGPANFIYFPRQTGQIPATYQIMALPQASKTTNDIFIGRDQPGGYRTHVGSIDYDHLLVISQSTASSCVHVIDGQWPLFSSEDPDQVRLVGKYSKADQVIGGANSPKLPVFMFGSEPAHRWCYYFEKADLALQSEDWKAVADLGAQVAKAGLHPEDWTEWTPFLQAYAQLGDVSAFTAAAHRLNGDPFARIQACATLTGLQHSGLTFSTGYTNPDQYAALPRRVASREVFCLHCLLILHVLEKRAYGWRSMPPICSFFDLYGETRPFFGQFSPYHHRFCRSATEIPLQLQTPVDFVLLTCCPATLQPYFAGARKKGHVGGVLCRPHGLFFGYLLRDSPVLWASLSKPSFMFR